MTIILIGYMGSGKTTIGQNLSQIIDFEFVDLDDYIQIKEGMNIPDIFKSKGEIYFRKKEHLYLKEVLSKKNIVLSLGGGTPCYGTNMEAILNAKHAHSIYLKSALPNLVERLKNEKHKRPLIAHLNADEELTEFIGKHLFERSFYYNQSHQTIVTDNKNVREVTQEIVASLF